MANPIEIHAFQIVTLLFEHDLDKDSQLDGETIVALTKLSPRDINDAVGFLSDKAYIKKVNFMGTAPFDFGYISLSANGKHLYHELKSKKDIRPRKPREVKSKASMKVFISHSNKDAEIAKEIIQLLRLSLNLKTEDIRCTSVDGYRLPAGVSTDEQLKIEIHDSEVLVGLISAESMSSHYVLFELGARWGARKPLFPLITDEEGTKILKGPLQGINALNAHEEAQLFQLVEDVGKQLKIKPEGANSYQHHIKAIRVLLANKPNAPKQEVKKASSARNNANEATVNDYSDADDHIKEHCKKQWPDDFHMQVHCIAEQRKAVQLLQKGRPGDITEDEFLLIRKKAAKDWPYDFHMRAHQEQEQFSAIRSLRD